MAFWGRRARRLLPALLLLLVAVSIYAAVEVPSTELGRLRWDGISGLFYVANWRFVASGQSYFDLFSGTSPFRHLWSLAIEEQFYLVWPLVTLGCLRLGRGRLRVLGAVALGGVVCVDRAHGGPLRPRRSHRRSYYGTDTHAHPILIGVLLALVLVDRTTVSRRPPAPWTASAWSRSAASSRRSRSRTTRHRRCITAGRSRSHSWSVAVLIAAVMRAPEGLLARALRFRPFVLLGMISYGVYLWHWPVIVYASEHRTGLSGLSLDRLRIAADPRLLDHVLRSRRASDPARSASIASRGPPRPRASPPAWSPCCSAPPARPRRRPTTTPPRPLRPRARRFRASVPGNPSHVVLVGDSLAASLGPGLDDAVHGPGRRVRDRGDPGVLDPPRGDPRERRPAVPLVPGLRRRDHPGPADRRRHRAAPRSRDLARDLGRGRPRPRRADGQARDPRRRRRPAGGGPASREPPHGEGCPPGDPHGAPTRAGQRDGPAGARRGFPRPEPQRSLPAVRAHRRTAASRSSTWPRSCAPAVGALRRSRASTVRPDGSHFGPEGSQLIGRELADSILTCWHEPSRCT